MPSQVVREIKLLKAVKHPHIVHLQDVFLSSSSVYLVFEYLDLDLRQYMNAHGDQAPDRWGSLSPGLVKSFTWQVLKAVTFCHEHRILHRDIKPANLLVNRSGDVKISDFGLASTFGTSVNPFTGGLVATLFYRAPEILLGSRSYGPEIDLWSVGVVMAEMISGRALFSSTSGSEREQLSVVYRVLGTPNSQAYEELLEISPETRTGIQAAPATQYCPADLKETLRPYSDHEGFHLLSLLVQFRPRARLSATEALLHSYFSGHSNTPSPVPRI